MRSTMNHVNMRGEVRAFYSRECRSNRCPLRQRKTQWCSNAVLQSWCGLLVPLLLGDDPLKYRIGAMYIEYENNGGAAVTPPEFSREDSASEYYADLALSSTRDYLRVPIIARTTDRDDGFEFDNILTVTARTSGSVGQHGRAFTAAAQSRVYGGAAVAMPDEADASQDRVLSRFYFTDTAAQLVKILGSEIGYDWRFTTT